MRVKCSLTLLTLGVLATLFLLQLASGAEIPAGIYKSESNLDDPAFLEYMKVMGYEEEIWGQFRSGQSILLLLTQINETYWQINYNGPVGNTVRLQFQYGEEFKAELMDGRRAKQKVSLEDSGKTVREINMGRWTSTQVAVFVEEDGGGLDLILRAKEVEAKMEFSLYERNIPANL